VIIEATYGKQMFTIEVLKIATTLYFRRFGVIVIP
jgi:hypothetical protein